MNRKSLSSVVATALLIVVTVITVIGFQNWFGSFSSNTFVEVEDKSTSNFDTKIEAVIGNLIYFKNSGIENITIKKIKIGNNFCNISEQNVSTGIKIIDIGNCSMNIKNYAEYITIITNKEVYSKKEYFSNVDVNYSGFVSEGTSSFYHIVDDFNDGILNQVQFNLSNLILDNTSENYFISGNYTSKVYNANGLANWTNLTWDYHLEEINLGEGYIPISSEILLGNLTARGGLSAAFDTETSETIANSAGSLSYINSGTCGVDWGVEKSIKKVIIYNPIDSFGVFGDHDLMGLNIMISLEGSNDNNNWIEIDSVSFLQNYGVYSVIIDNLTGSYRYYRIKFTHAVESLIYYLAELEFYGLNSAKTYLIFQTRTSNDNLIWTNWRTQILPLEEINESAQYFQYRVLFDTENETITPILNSVSFDYKLN